MEDRRLIGRVHANRRFAKTMHAAFAVLFKMLCKGLYVELAFILEESLNNKEQLFGVVAEITARYEISSVVVHFYTSLLLVVKLGSICVA